MTAARHSQVTPPRHSRERGNPEPSGLPAIDHLDIWTGAWEKKASGGRGRNGKHSPYGIQKLRELILELAVRGRLVPQDPNDEPASVLLERIAEEKARLVKEGKIKKQKKLPRITEEEKLLNLPQRWEWSRLGCIGLTQTGGTPKKADTHHYGDFIPFLKPADISDGKIISYNNDGLSEDGAKALSRVAPEDSILMVCIGTIGKCARVDRNVSFNQQINSVTPFLPIGSYVATYLRSPPFQKMVWAAASSTTIAILNKGKWASIPIAIPPLPEQHRIVAKVDELMALCDRLEQEQTDSREAHQTLVETLLCTLVQAPDAEAAQQAWQRIAQHFDLLFTTETAIDQLKQTILQLAVLGKLVPQDPNDEPASVLLEKIAEEKARLVKEGKIKKQKRLPEISEEEKSIDLPEGWHWARLGEIGSVGSSGRVHKKDWKNTGVPFYRAREIVKLSQNGHVNNELFISESLYQELSKKGYIPEKGDVMITGVGTIGIPYIVKERERFYFKDASVLIFKNTSVFDRFLFYFMKSPYWVKEIHAGSMGTTVHTLTINRANNISVPLPPLPEQHRIVAKTDELMALCDALKARIQQAETTQRHLADAVVRQAVI